MYIRYQIGNPSIKTESVVQNRWEDAWMGL